MRANDIINLKSSKKLMRLIGGLQIMCQKRLPKILTPLLKSVTFVTPLITGVDMSTTSLKLPDSLKQRVNALAELAGKSPHAFMVDAIAEQAERVEEDRAFMAQALVAKKHYDETGIGYDVDEVHAYLRAKIQGVMLPEPKPVKRN